MISAMHIESRGIASSNGFLLMGAQSPSQISHQRVLGFQKAWPFSFFRMHPAWKTLVSLLLFDIRIRRCHYKLIPSLLLKYRIRLGILSQMGIVATRYVWVYKKARGLNEKSCFLS